MVLTKQKKALVTGGAGFIGSRIVRLLIKQGYSVRVIDNFCNAPRDSLRDIEDRIQLFVGDVRDKKLVAKALSGVDIVFHLAAMVSVFESVQKPQQCDEINRVASEYIIDLCAERGIRFMFASSAAVYGDQTAPVISENLAAKPISPYGHSKLSVEEYCKKKAGEHTDASHSRSRRKFEYLCLRCFNVYGKGQNASSAYASVIPKFFKTANAGDALTVFGDGLSTRDYVHVNDIVDAYVAASRAHVSGVFNVGTGIGTSVKELAMLILQQTQSNSKVLFKPPREGDILHSVCSNKAFIKATGWRPTVKVADAIVALSVQRDYTNPAEKHINPKKRLLIAMPAFNEGPVIAGVVTHLRESGFDNILVVNDCSRDNTAAEAKRAGAFVVNHIINRGAGAATATAIGYAKKYNYDFICLMDADGQHNPRDIEPLLLAAQRYDIVIGSRNLGDDHMPLLRKVANSVGSFVTFLFFSVYAQDSQTGFRILNRKAIENVKMKYDRFEFASEMFGEIARLKLTWSEVPITVIYTDHSKAKGQSIPNGFRMIARFLLKN